MNEREFIIKLLEKRSDFSYLVGEYDNCDAVQRTIANKEKASIKAGSFEVAVPDDIAYICTAVVRRKQDRLLAQIKDKCAEITNMINQHIEEQDKSEDEDGI